MHESNESRRWISIAGSRARSKVVPSLLVLGIVAAAWAGCTVRTRPDEGGESIGKQSERAGKRKISRRAGDVIDAYMDEQLAQLITIPAVQAERAGFGIRLTWGNASLFDFDSAMLKPSSRDAVRRLADVLVRHPETDVVITGHTDSVGDDAYNRKLSERRALSVRNLLVEMGVAASRIESLGFGELQPIAENDTPEGRERNQRVEITLGPSEALVARATGARRAR